MGRKRCCCERPILTPSPECNEHLSVAGEPLAQPYSIMVVSSFEFRPVSTFFLLAVLSCCKRCCYISGGQVGFIITPMDNNVFSINRIRLCFSSLLF